MWLVCDLKQLIIISFSVMVEQDLLGQTVHI